MNEYNPATDGFEAKAWECLRRNPEFKLTVGGIVDCSPDEYSRRLRHALIRTRTFQNSFAGGVIAALLGDLHRPPDKRPKEPWWPKVNLNTPWPELPPLLRGIFGLSFGGTLDNRAIVVTDRDEAIALLDSHTVIALPVFPGRYTKTQVLADLSSLIPEAKTGPGKFSPGARTLGAELDWRVYLHFERWIALGFSHDDSCNLAAHACFTPIRSFESADAARGALHPTARNVLPAIHKRFKIAIEHVDRVKQAIDDVFPRFRPSAE